MIIMIPDFNKLKIGDRVLICDGAGSPLKTGVVMDKVHELPGVQTVLVNIGGGAQRCFRYVSIHRLRNAD